MGSTVDDPPLAQQILSKESASSDGDTTSAKVPPFSYYSNAQSDFKPPLIANGNAFLGDVFST
ncbi:MAG: hypothetical protein L6R39_004493, partial [Caloplaca ligustica]